jgi:hypothetical protein
MARASIIASNFFMLHPSFINFGTKNGGHISGHLIFGVAEQRPREGAKRRHPFLDGEKLCEKENP